MIEIFLRGGEFIRKKVSKLGYLKRLDTVAKEI